jgi:asparagine synthase (glutamine-hydrolysing)
MCGIGGVFYGDPNHPVDPAVLIGMAAIQYHRGPDGFGYEVVPDRGIGFTHARLSIIDLDPERGRQPFRSTDGQYLIAHNGEFYDYKRLRADLTSRGYRFRTKSDTELVLHLTERLGLVLSQQNNDE